MVDASSSASDTGGFHSHKNQALLMSLGAGMATGVGACFVLCARTLDKRLLACSMAFSAGVMMYVSLADVLTVAYEYYAQYPGRSSATAYGLATLSVFAGVLVMAFVDWIVHECFHHATNAAKEDSPSRQLRSAQASRASHDEFGERIPGSPGDPTISDTSEDSGHDHGRESILAVAIMEEKRRLLMMAMVVSAAIVLHNIPEGMATYAASFDSVVAGAPLAFAIAVHNIPEGLSVAMPLLHATGSKWKAIALGALSGMAEPFGAVLASFVANEDSPAGYFGGLFGLTAGMMLFVCVAELLPGVYGAPHGPPSPWTSPPHGPPLPWSPPLTPSCASLSSYQLRTGRRPPSPTTSPRPSLSAAQSWRPASSSKRSWRMSECQAASASRTARVWSDEELPPCTTITRWRLPLWCGVRHHIKKPLLRRRLEVHQWEASDSS